MDLSALQPPLPPMLVIEGPVMPGLGGRSHSPEMQGRATRVALPGLVQMLMTPPQFAQVPKEMIAATLDWLSILPEQVPAKSDRNAGQPISESNSTGSTNELTLAGSASAPEVMGTERPVFFGADALLFGIITQPPANDIRRRAVIVLNAGADHHIGASRLYVSMARRWAQHGYVVLRMDLGGVGDSGTRAGRVADNVFPEEAIDDIRAAIDFLRSSHGVRDVTLAGLCSGAYHALRKPLPACRSIAFSWSTRRIISGSPVKRCRASSWSKSSAIPESTVSRYSRWPHGNGWLPARSIFCASSRYICSVRFSRPNPHYGTSLAACTFACRMISAPNSRKWSRAGSGWFSCLRAASPVLTC